RLRLDQGDLEVDRERLRAKEAELQAQRRPQEEATVVSNSLPMAMLNELQRTLTQTEEVLERTQGMLRQERQAHALTQERAARLERQVRNQEQELGQLAEQREELEELRAALRQR